MARFQPAIATNCPEALALKGLIKRGQFIDYEGTRGRYVGNRAGVVWYAWGKCNKKFAKLCEAFDTQVIR